VGWDRGGRIILEDVTMPVGKRSNKMKIIKKNHGLLVFFGKYTLNLTCIGRWAVNIHDKKKVLFSKWIFPQKKCPMCQERKPLHEMGACNECLCELYKDECHPVY
jgi:hypothetical protein